MGVFCGYLVWWGSSSGTAHFLYLYAMKVIGPVKASSFLILVPIVGILGDAALGELPGTFPLLGGVLAL